MAILVKVQIGEDLIDMGSLDFSPLYDGDSFIYDGNVYQVKSIYKEIIEGETNMFQFTYKAILLRAVELVS